MQPGVNEHERSKPFAQPARLSSGVNNFNESSMVSINNLSSSNALNDSQKKAKRSQAAAKPASAKKRIRKADPLNQQD